MAAGGGIYETGPMPSVARLGAQDWERLREVRLRALADAPDAFGSTWSREAGLSAREWRSMIERNPWWISVDGGSDAGLVAGGAHHERDIPWVYSMWVDPTRRGTGLAILLLDEVVAWARGTGAASLGLDVTDRAPEARRLYERYGFTANGRTFELPRDPAIRLVEMVLDLRAGV